MPHSIDGVRAYDNRILAIAGGSYNQSKGSIQFLYINNILRKPKLIYEEDRYINKEGKSGTYSILPTYAIFWLLMI